jgi:hypothetical protein
MCETCLIDGEPKFETRGGGLIFLGKHLFYKFLGNSRGTESVFACFIQNFEHKSCMKSCQMDRGWKTEPMGGV